MGITAASTNSPVSKLVFRYLLIAYVEKADQVVDNGKLRILHVNHGVMENCLIRQKATRFTCYIYYTNRKSSNRDLEEKQRKRGKKCPYRLIEILKSRS